MLVLSDIVLDEAISIFSTRQDEIDMPCVYLAMRESRAQRMAFPHDPKLLRPTFSDHVMVTFVLVPNTLLTLRPTRKSPFPSALTVSLPTKMLSSRFLYLAEPVLKFTANTVGDMTISVILPVIKIYAPE